MSRIPQTLERLVRLYGIQTSYRDMRGEKQLAPVESLIAVARAMGAKVEGLDDVDKAIQTRELELWNRAVEPVVVAWNGKVPPIRLRTLSIATDVVRGMLTLEDGSTQELEIRPRGLPVRGRHEVGKNRYVEREWTIGPRLPHGYHRLDLEIERNKHETLIVSAPMKAHFPFERKEWGIFAPLYSLHSARHPNAGTLTEFESLMDWMGDHDGRVAATLPLLAGFLDTPFEPSPYSPASRLFWNEFYVDAGRTPRASHANLVDYRREMRFRRGLLEDQAAAFFRSRNDETSHFSKFIEENPELVTYARFRAVTERHAAGWTGWPSRLRDGRIETRDYDKDIERYHLYAQWRVRSQLGRLAEKATRNGQVLYLDLPLGLHPDSYDIWRYRDLFVREASGGAPPDPVFTKGQNWGFPPMHPETSRLHHYEYTIAYIRNHLQNARLLRIDHVMGLHRLFWIPQGFTGDKGVYVSYPADELYAILCVESHRNKAGIVGENLGTVPPEVNSSMKRHNIQQMYVVQYELEGNDPRRALESVTRNTVASLNTHDMAPFRAFLSGRDIEDRLDLGFLDTAGAENERTRRDRMKKILVEFLRKKKLLTGSGRSTPIAIFRATMRFLASSVANIVLVNIDDLWGETLPQNVPATQAERPNWRRRTRLGLEEIEESSSASKTLQLIKEGRHESGR